MKEVTRRVVLRSLRRLGFNQAGNGNGSGHTVFVNGKGQRILCPIRKKGLPIAYAYTLGTQLEKAGVCTRSGFISSLRGR